MWISHALFNHILSQQTDIKAALSHFARRSWRITALGIRTDMRVNEDGFVEPLPEGDAPECSITIHASAWSKLLQGESIGVGDIALEGDAALAMQLLPILSSVRYQPYVDAARLFGNTAASHIDHQCRSWAESVTQMARSVEGEIRDFLQENNAPLLSRSVWEAQQAEIEALRDDVARLSEHVRRLEAKIDAEYDGE